MRLDDAAKDPDVRQTVAWWGERPARKPDAPDPREWARWHFWQIWGKAAGEYVAGFLAQGRLSDRALRAGEWLAKVVVDIEREEAAPCP